ncbi:hypothetical protein [Brevibacillus sp. HB2.2]|uniref:hypothetical protein n=1 Tax=Brevibacillus sp. HB2.2 TaxID=2738846 RepID=UPI00156B539B|nr:hypothetical protein [Brevibacillus sp. HB2.2]NRS51971.1 hypothetical protein [Brevibacillus sp. HB2.2]
MLEQLPLTEIAKIVIPGIIAFMTGRYLSRHSRNINAAQEQFDKAYLPMYKIIEPYLYSDNEDERELLIAVKLINQIANKNKHLVPEILRLELNSLVNRMESKDNYAFLIDFVSWSIEKRYFQLLSILGYPRRIGIFNHMHAFSIRRLTARLRRLDLLLGKVILVLLFIPIFILISTFLYNLFIRVLTFIAGLST